MKVFDLHCHPTLKPMLTLARQRETPWDEVDNIASKIFDSQSNLEQLLDGNCNLACVGLMAIETAFLQGCLVQTVAGPVKYIDKRQVKRIAQKVPGYCYEDLLDQEIKSVVQHASNPHESWESVKWIQSMDEYDADDMDTLHLIATLEGGHGLYHGRNKADDIDLMVEKIKAYRKGNPVRLLYITLTHISQNVFANHSYAIKILGKKPFLPLGNGITEKGHKIIQTCLDDTLEGNPIFIDIKHLSLVSRLQFYKAYGDKPMIASHMAVTGCSYHKKPIFKVRKKKAHDVYKVKYKRQAGYLPNTYFNPDSINLYDEDIEAILRSGGLIGLILDERVLGYSKSDTSKEFISNHEWDAFIAPDGVQQDLSAMEMDSEQDATDDAQDLAMELEEEDRLAGIGTEPKKSERYIHLLHLLNNIMHIIKVGQAMDGDIDPTKHIVLGSDFDGLVNAVDCCLTAEGFNNLRFELMEVMEQYASDLIDDPTACANDMFYNNGVNFLKKHY
jgi:microsomal dipeptidase-like Zn-dependent dipeptidase